MWHRLTALVLALAAAGIVAAGVPGSAGANHGDCAVTTNGPFLSYGIYAFATADVVCGSRKNNIVISAELLRDGVVVDSVVERRHRDTSWSAYLIENDAAGVQTWCFRVEVRVNPHQLDPITTCADF